METEQRVSSFRERSAWANLIVTVLVIGAYKVQTYLAGPNADAGRAIGAFLGAIVVLVVVTIVVNIVIALTTPQEPKDERDLSIERTAYRNAYFALTAGVWTAVPMAMLWSGLETAANAPATLPGIVWLHPSTLGQVLFLCFVFAECVHLATQVILYRRTAG